MVAPTISKVAPFTNDTTTADGKLTAQVWIIFNCGGGDRTGANICTNAPIIAMEK